MLVSIIVPVYNSERYLPRCLDSIKNQTFSLIEIVLIDDGSTDHSGIICDRYASEDSRIRVIHSNNQGQSVARNTGLLNARGDCVFFMDSDDELSPYAIELLHDAYSKSNADCVIGDAQRVDHTGTIVKNLWKQDDIIFNCDKIEGIFHDYFEKKHLNKILIDVWGKLFKMETIKKHTLCFDESMKSHENMLFMFQFLSLTKKLHYVNKIIYTYYRNQDNIGSGYLINDPLVFKKAYFFIRDWMEKKGVGKKEEFGNAFTKEAIATIYLLTQRIKIGDFSILYNKIKLVVEDIDVQRNLKFYGQANEGDFTLAPYFMKMRWIMGIIIMFKLRIFVK